MGSKKTRVFIALLLATLLLAGCVDDGVDNTPNVGEDTIDRGVEIITDGQSTAGGTIDNLCESGWLTCSGD